MGVGRAQEEICPRERLLLLRLVGLLGDLSRGDLLDERGDHRELLGELVEVWENLSLSLGQILETINIFKTIVATYIFIIAQNCRVHSPPCLMHAL